MTALDNMGEGSTQGSGKSSRLSLRQGRKRALNSDISPAPEPRTSHRFRTSSSSDTDDRNKVSMNPIIWERQSEGSFILFVFILIYLVVEPKMNSFY